LQPYVQPQRQSAEAELQQAHQYQKQAKTLLSREFPWVFYPEADLLQLLRQFE
jgi:hypothetical protein